MISFNGVQLLKNMTRDFAVLQRAKVYIWILAKTYLKIEVNYVGQVFTHNGVKPDPEKVKAILIMQKPKNRQELLPFLGLVKYFRKFLPRLSDVSASLRKLTETSSGSKWKWTKEQYVSFKLYKTMIT